MLFTGSVFFLDYGDKPEPAFDEAAVVLKGKLRPASADFPGFPLQIAFSILVYIIPLRHPLAPGRAKVIPLFWERVIGSSSVEGVPWYFVHYRGLLHPKLQQDGEIPASRLWKASFEGKQAESTGHLWMGAGEKEFREIIQNICKFLFHKEESYHHHKLSIFF